MHPVVKPKPRTAKIIAKKERVILVNERI